MTPAPPWAGPLRLGGVVVLAAASREVLPEGEVGAAVARLGPGLRDRHDRLARPADRLDLLAGRALARRVVARHLGAEEDDVLLTQRCPACGDDGHGRPTATVGAESVAVSWAHSGGEVAAAAGPAHLGVGVDVENGSAPDWPGATPSERTRLSAEPRPEAAFRLLWSAKEAVVKTGALALRDAERVGLDDVAALGVRWWSLAGPREVALGLAVRRV